MTSITFCFFQQTSVVCWQKYSINKTNLSSLPRLSEWIWISTENVKRKLKIEVKNPPKSSWSRAGGQKSSVLRSKMETREDLSDFQMPSIEKILLGTLPEKSVKLYLRSWNLFTKKMELNNDTIPCEEDYLRYFHFLRHEKKLKGSTLWSIYSRLNGVHQRRFSKFLFHTYLRPDGILITPFFRWASTIMATTEEVHRIVSVWGDCQKSRYFLLWRACLICEKPKLQHKILGRSKSGGVFCVFRRPSDMRAPTAQLRFYQDRRWWCWSLFSPSKTKAWDQGNTSPSYWICDVTYSVYFNRIQNISSQITDQGTRFAGPLSSKTTWKLQNTTWNTPRSHWKHYSTRRAIKGALVT